MNTDANGLKHSWLGLSLRLGLSIIGFAAVSLPFDQATLHVDDQTYLWKAERAAIGRIVQPEQNGVNHSTWGVSGKTTKIEHLLPSRLRFGNIVTELAAPENERDFLVRMTVQNEGSARSASDLAGLIRGQAPLQVHISPEDARHMSPENSLPNLKPFQVKIVHQDHQTRNHLVVTEDQLTETKVIDVFPASRSLWSSRGYHHFQEVRVMEATAYYPGPECTGKYAARVLTYTGKKAGYGLVAVDPRVIPLGTCLYIEGYGYAEAADIGGAIKGNSVDLCFETYQEAVNYGRQRVKVYILKK